MGVALEDESGTALPGVVWLLLLATGLFVFLAVVLHWAVAQVPTL